MNHPLLLAFLPVILATCAGGAAPSDVSAQGDLGVESNDPIDPRVAAARAALRDEGPDAALAITDELLREHPKNQAGRLIAGEAQLALTALDRPGLDKRLVLRDAVRELEQAERLGAMPPTAWLHLGEAYYGLGEFDRAREAATRALEAFSAKEDGTPAADPALLGRSALVAARCDMQQFVELRRVERESGERDSRGIARVGEQTMALAQAALTRLDVVQQTLPAEGYPLAATVFQWLDEQAQAVATLERGVQRAPQVAEVHLAYQNMLQGMSQQRALVGAYRRFVKEAPGQTMTIWFHARAELLLADDLRRQGAFDRALSSYGVARDIYGEYAAMMPAFAESARQMIAICEMSLARTSVDMGDLAGAERHLWAADEASPAATQYGQTLQQPVLSTSDGSHFAGLVSAISRAHSESGQGALERTVDFCAKVLERHPQRFGFVYNNAALAARDLGVALVAAAERGDAAAKQQALRNAMELWERSYRWYETAVELTPDDARFANDCALMLIYHLHRDFGRARELCERAIAIGQPQLDAMPQDAPEADRRYVEEAVGDAYQNIAVLLAGHLQRPFAEYEPFLQQAVKYYPGQRREAAQMLRTRGLAAADAAGQGQGQGKGDAEKLKKAQAEAEAKASDGDLDAALLVLDGVAKDLARYAPFQAARGDFALRYARAARDAGRGGVDLLFADAVNALQKAVEMDAEPSKPRLMLAEAQYGAGQLEAALKTANELLLHLQSQGGGDPELVRATHLVRANAGARSYIEQRQAGKDPTELLQSVRTSFRYLEEQGALDAQLAGTWSTTEAWAGAGAEAVAIHVRLLRKNPDDQALIAAVVDTAAQQRQGAVAVEALKGRDDATSLFYLGRAHFQAAAELRDATKNKEAIAELDAAQQAFERSMQQNKEFEVWCKPWVAICLGKKGNIAFWMDDLKTAEQCLMAAARLAPERITDDLGLGETVKQGIVLVADKYMKQRDLAKVEAIYREAASIAHADLDLLNNAGLFARDWGNQLERQGKQKEALEMYEQSYQAYSRANELDPTNVRLANDRALIAIWYLERDWDLSKRLLDEAIPVGERQLKEIPGGEVQQRQDLEEAIGDCWENLALWHLKHDKDAAAAKAAAQKSLQYHPGERRPGAQRHLREAERLLGGK